MSTSADAGHQIDLTSDYPCEELRQALDDGQLELHYQPIVGLADGAVQRFEALVRWRHPGGALLLPDDFLAQMAHSRMMPRFTRWVLHTACSAAACGLDAVAVNVSASDICRVDLLADVTAALSESGLPAKHLTIELTEHAVVQDLEGAAVVLAELRDMGVGVALDDFGTGYSSLFYLRALPISELKIDSVFVAALDRDEEDAAIVESVVRLARAVGLSAVAEGVEEEGQAAALLGMGCPAAQGHLWGSAAPADDHADRPRQLPVVDPAAARRRRRGTPAPPEALGVVRDMLDRGASLHTIAAALNRAGVLTSRGTRWSSTAVAHAVTTL
jgi:EAL domain-containing protein (putative c-di-GMP-specific phosphodiesterase class I)